MARPEIGVRLAPKQAGAQVDARAAGRATPRGVVPRPPCLAAPQGGGPSSLAKARPEMATRQPATVAAGGPVSRLTTRAPEVGRVTVVVTFVGAGRVVAGLAARRTAMGVRAAQVAPAPTLPWLPAKEAMTVEGPARDPKSASEAIVRGAEGRAPMAIAPCETKGAVGGVRPSTVASTRAKATPLGLIGRRPLAVPARAPYVPEPGGAPPARLRLP